MIILVPSQETPAKLFSRHVLAKSLSKEMPVRFDVILEEQNSIRLRPYYSSDAQPHHSSSYYYYYLRELLMESANKANSLSSWNLSVMPTQ